MSSKRDIYGGGGARRLSDEKQLLTELSKLFHVVKAVHREQQQCSSAAARRKGQQQPAQSGGESGARRRRAKRSRGRSANGSTIWIVLKGGFHRRTVPTAAEVARVASRAAHRIQRSNERRLQALQQAEGLVQSAWQQATEAGLIQPDGVPTDDGDAYLKEQYITASRMVQPPAAGSFLRQLVQTHGGSSGAAAPTTAAGEAALQQVASLPAAPASEQTPMELEDIISREAAILYRYTTALTPSMPIEEMVQVEKTAHASSTYFPICEPLLVDPATAQTGATEANSTTSSVLNAGDILPTKCIVRMRNSQRDKYTGILSSKKAVNTFRTQFMQVVRKELSNAKLPRAPADGHEALGDGRGPSAATASSGAAKSAGQSHASQNGKRKKRR